MANNPKPELSEEDAVKFASKEVEIAMIENIMAGRAETEVAIRKKAARFALQKANERLHGLYQSFM